MAQQEATLLLKIKQLGSDALSKTTKMLADLGNTAKWVGAGIAGFAALALKNYRDQELAVNELNQAMINQGIYTGELSRKYQDQASALQRLTTFGDEQILSAQAVLQAQIGQREVTKDLTLATLNLAAAKKMDLASAAELVGKSIGTGTNALARQGIEMKENLSTTEKYATVIEQLNNKFGGQAEAAAMGLGAVKQLQNNFSDVLETIGEKLSPVITAGARALSSWVISLGNSKQFISGLDSSITFLTKGFFILKNAVVGVGGVIGTTLAAAIESVSLLTQGQFARAKEVAALGMSEVGQIIKDSKATLDEELAMIDEQKALAEDQKRIDEEAKLAASLARKTIVHQNEANKQLAIEKKTADEKKKIDDKRSAEQLQNQKDTFATIATLQNSNNKSLAAIGKAAAITQIAIDTPVAISKALAAFPPPFNFAAAGLVGAAMAAQAARIAGVQLAEGGVIKATPGGIPAIIGEGGRDEAVIPLEDGQVPGSGGVNITINGNLIGDEQSLYALAKMLDPQMLKLRQNNESVAFDTGVL